MGIGMHLKYKTHLTHYIFKLWKLFHTQVVKKNETHSCPTFLPNKPYSFEDKMEFYDWFFYFVQILYLIIPACLSPILCSL